MAEYDWGSEKAWIKLGQPYLFTEKYYNYCKTRHAPIAVIYYDTKTSTPSKELYASAFNSKDGVKTLYRKLSSYKIQNPAADKFKGGYCCLMVLDRCGNISSPGADQRFFANELLKSSNLPFVVLALYYDGKTHCHQLPATTSIDQLADAIYQKCESGSGGVGKFSAWPGRQAWIDHQSKMPDQEVKPDVSGSENLDSGITSIGVPPYWEDPTAQKKYADYDSDYSGNFAGIQKINNRPEVTWMLNLADVSTPETTYYLIGSYDMNHSDNCPWHADSILTNYVNADTKVQTKNTECHNGKYKELYEKGKKYRFFVFYEFSHGGHQSVTICTDFSYAYVWDHFTSLATTQRVWGIFDSCHSGSMIIKSGVTPHSAATQFAAVKSENQTNQEKLPEGIFGYLDRKFSRRKALLSAAANRQTALAAANNDPRLTLWSSTGQHSYGWYNWGMSTSFTVGMYNAFTATYWDAGSRKYLYRQTRYGWAGARDDDPDAYKYNNGGQTGEQAFKKVQYCGKENHGSDTLNTCIPQCRNYPQHASPETTILFY